MEDYQNLIKGDGLLKGEGGFFSFQIYQTGSRNNSLNKRGGWKYFLEIPTLVRGQKSDLYNIDLLNMTGKPRVHDEILYSPFIYYLHFTP